MRSGARKARRSSASGGADAIDRYVAELGRALRGSAAHRRDILREVRDGLQDAAAAHEEAGLDPPEARRQAVGEFGAVREIAPGLQAELNFAQGRRTGWLLSFLVILQSLIAQFGWRHDADAVGPGVSLGDGYLLLARAMDWFQLGTVSVGIAAIVLFGWGGRRIPVGSRLVSAVGGFVVVALVAKSVLAFLLVALVPGMLPDLLHPLGLLQQLCVWILPTGYVMYAAGRCWTTLPGRLR